MKLQNNKGFTLIELLVVITIIGILAVGATTTYIPYIKKSRDSTRITELTKLNGSIEGAYMLKSVYPDSSKPEDFKENVGMTLTTFPKDPKSGEACLGASLGATTIANTPCDFLYISGPDSKNIRLGAYNVSTGFEFEGNVETMANNDSDNGLSNARLEYGADLKQFTSGFTALNDLTPEAAAIGTVTSCGNFNGFMPVAGKCD